MANKIRQYFPNFLTFLSLGFGSISIFAAIDNQIMTAGLLIIVSVVFDIMDGYFARKMGVATNFGKQLDSLADIVSFGIAPLVLVHQHLSSRELMEIWLYPLMVITIWAGAFRLARFNLQPQKQSINEDSRGITITNSGVILCLAVLSDLSNPNASLAQGSYYILFLILSYLMISKLNLPSLTWLLSSRRIVVVYLILAIVLYFFSSIFTSILALFLIGLAAMITKKIYHIFFQRAQSL